MCVHVYALFTSRSLFLILTKLIRGNVGRRRKKRENNHLNPTNSSCYRRLIGAHLLDWNNYKRISTFSHFFPSFEQ